MRSKRRSTSESLVHICSLNGLWDMIYLFFLIFSLKLPFTTTIPCTKLRFCSLFQIYIARHQVSTPSIAYYIYSYFIVFWYSLLCMNNHWQRKHVMLMTRYMIFVIFFFLDEKCALFLSHQVSTWNLNCIYPRSLSTNWHQIFILFKCCIVFSMGKGESFSVEEKAISKLFGV